MLPANRRKKTAVSALGYHWTWTYYIYINFVDNVNIVIVSSQLPIYTYKANSISNMCVVSFDFNKKKKIMYNENVFKWVRNSIKYIGNAHKTHHIWYFVTSGGEISKWNICLILTHNPNCHIHILLVGCRVAYHTLLCIRLHMPIEAL